MTAAQRRYRRTEMAVAAAISAVLSGVFVALLFGGQAVVPVAGWNGLIVDALPQTAMIALMSSLVPTLLTRRRTRCGGVAPLLTASRWPAAAVLRIGAFVLLATMLAGGLHAVLLPLGPPAWPLSTVFAGKILYGAGHGGRGAGGDCGASRSGTMTIREGRGSMQMNDRPNRRAAILAEVRCTAMALTALTAFVGSFWMAGVLF